MSLDAMKQALAALNDCTYDEEGYCLNPDNVDAILALRAAIEQAQEPVGWFGYDKKINTWFETNEGEDDSVPLYAGSRGWKGLTGEEVAELTLEHVGYPVRLTGAIEAKLRERNT